MDGVHADIGIAVADLDIDDDEVVDVFHVVADLRFQETLVDGGADDQVASSAVCDLVADVVVELELPVCPLHFDLRQCQYIFSMDRLRDIPVWS